MINAPKLRWRKESNKDIFKMKCNKLFLVVLLVVFNFSHAQNIKNIEKQSLLWTRYVALFELSKKWTVVAEVDERVFSNTLQQNTLVSRLQGRFKTNENIEIGGGVAYFSVTSTYPEINPGFQTPEYRLQQDLTLRQKVGKFGFTQRYQIEQRFMDRFDKMGNYLGNEFYFRYRFKIQTDFKIWKTEKKFLNAIIYDEIMINGGSNVIYNSFDQNRIYAALHYGFNDNFSMELGYLNSYQQKSSGIDYFDRNIIRLSLYHKFKYNN
jgi:hypothetical protein